MSGDIKRCKMENTNTICPVCTLYLREGINLETHLHTHPKEQVIEALLKFSNGGTFFPPGSSLSASSTLSSTTSSSTSLSLSSSTSVENSQTSVQTLTNSASPFISGPYVAPQTQMTTAVTYQHFMTSNGSTILPQFIQVPTVINPNTNIPMVSNQMSLIPNQPVNYSPTMYNPLYNPYIPQPYPFTQPLFTTMPITALPTNETTAPAENVSGNEEVSNKETTTMTTESSVVVKNTVVTSTSSGIRSFNTGSKKTLSKYKKKFKKRIIKSKSKVKDMYLSVMNSPKKNSDKSCRLVKKSVISTIRPKITLQTSTTTSNLTVVPPAPLTLITKPTTNSNINPATPPPPPPLSKAPCMVPLSPSSASLIKSEDVKDRVRPQSTPAIINSSETSRELNSSDKPKKLNSVIIESNKKLSVLENCQKQNKLNEVEAPIDEESSTIIMRRENDCGENSLRVQNNDDIIITKVATPVENYVEKPGGEGHEKRIGEEKDFSQSVDNLEKTAKFFELIEVVEETKARVTEDNLNAEVPKNIGLIELERSLEVVLETCNLQNKLPREPNIELEKENLKDGAVIEIQTISLDCRDNRKVKEIGVPQDYCFNNKKLREVSSYNNVSSKDVVDATNQKQAELQSITYTDLQPVKSQRVYNDFPLAPTINLNTYMEVDGIKIFFNNNSATSVPFDPLVKLTNLQSNTGFFKSDSTVNNQTIMDSVIHIMSGNGSESKNGLAFGENFAATTSQIQEQELDLPDLSPLALNIQADESMPARGELSEQESLGAENSTWNLFHGISDASNTKKLEDWRDTVKNPSVPVTANNKTKKTFKCFLCNQVFSCPKERRVHKNKIHLNKTEKSLAPKRSKTYSCSFCSSVFTTLRDRKVHVLQTHIEDPKIKSVNQMDEIKQENKETEKVNVGDKPKTIKEEGEQGNIKTETSTEKNASATATSAITPSEAETQRVKYCSQCSFPFPGVKKLREHMRIVHGEIRFKCETCSQTFDCDSEYNEHLLIHPLVCDKCGKTFHKKPNLNLHMKRHLKVKPYECTLCPKSFITRQKLEEHMNGHSGKKPLKCPLCDKTFSRHSNLIQHRNLHHLNVKKKIKDFVCRCGEVFHSMRKLEWHKEVHDPKPKPCPFCSQKFVHSASVTRHIRRAHLPHYLPGDNREFDNVQCPVCEKIYLRSSLVVHMRVHNGEKPFACKICNKKFSTKWNLEIHNWTHQSRSNMPFKCHICKGAFFREPDFVAHLNAHRNFKPFTCNVCGQKFIRKYSCLRHQEEHKKNKQFVCGVSGCAKSFHRGYYLRDHMKVHTGVRPHTCHICGKASSTKSNHNKHVRIHDTREPVNTEN